MKYILPLICAALVVTGCKSDDEQMAHMKFSFEFDETLPRLNNLGEEAAVPDSHGTQHPTIKEMSAHYIELAQGKFTQLGQGLVVYKAPEVEVNGEMAVDFDKSKKASEFQEFLTIPISDLTPGTYEWVRVSLTYQLMDVKFRYQNPDLSIDGIYDGRIASFVGFNTFINSHTLKDSVFTVNDAKKQGYWAFETQIEGFGAVSSGESAKTTVVNPIQSTSPIPPGSCVVTGKLATPLVITGNETEDINLVLAFSINGSIEWVDNTKDGKWEPGAGEKLVDMGLRGLHPKVK